MAFQTMQNGEVKWGRAKKSKAQMKNTGGIKAVQRKDWGRRRRWEWNLEIATENKKTPSNTKLGHNCKGSMTGQKEKMSHFEVTTDLTCCCDDNYG